MNLRNDRNMKCPYIDECTQKIGEEEFRICEQRPDNIWSFVDCLKFFDLESEAKSRKATLLKTAKEWIKECS